MEMQRVLYSLKGLDPRKAVLSLCHRGSAGMVRVNDKFVGHVEIAANDLVYGKLLCVFCEDWSSTLPKREHKPLHVTTVEGLDEVHSLA